MPDVVVHDVRKGFYCVLGDKLTSFERDAKIGAFYYLFLNKEGFSPALTMYIGRSTKGYFIWVYWYRKSPLSLQLHSLPFHK